MQVGFSPTRSLARFAMICAFGACCGLSGCSQPATDNTDTSAASPAKATSASPPKVTRSDSSAPTNSNVDRSEPPNDAPKVDLIHPDDQNRKTADPASPALASKRIVPDQRLENTAQPKNVDELYAQAEAAGKQLAASLPQTIDAREILARIYWTTGKPLKAQEVWQGVVADSPNYPYALHGLGQVAAKLGDFESAAEYHYAAFEALPSFVDAGLSTAGAWTKIGELEKAQQILEGIAKQFPSMPLPWIRLGQAHTAAREFEQAKVAFERATKLAPQDADALYGLAIALSRTGHLEEAKRTQAKVQQLRQQLRDDTLAARKKNDDFLNQRREVAGKYASVGQVYFAAKRYTDAQAVWEQAAQLDPQNRSVRESLAALHMGFQDAEAALKVCQELLALQPDNSQYQLNVAMMLDRSGRTHEAIPTYLQIAQQSSSAESYAMLADAYARLGDSLAIKYIDKAIEVAPSNPQWPQLKQQYQQSLANQ